jgi:hypothetical protein
MSRGLLFSALVLSLAWCGRDGIRSGELLAKPVEIDFGPAILGRLERAIARHENCRKLHNPGCLVFRRQPGASRDASGYARFRTQAEGRLALHRDLLAKLKRGMTVEEILTAWNGGTYLDQVLRETSLARGDHW